VCVCVAKASHSHKTWSEVSSSALHFLHKGLSLSPIMWRCLLRVLCLVRRPITTLDCVLLKDNSLVLVAIWRPEINSRACLWVPARPCHSVVLFIQPALNFLLYTLPRNPLGWPRSNKIVNRTLPCELIGHFIFTYSRMSGDPKDSHWVVSGDIIQRPLALPYQ
jgi:hypothetical protein